jgi:hypothetical protein
MIPLFINIRHLIPMKTLHPVYLLLQRGLGEGMLMLLLGGCLSSPPPFPAPGTFQWATYTHATLPYTLSYPDVFTVHTFGNTTAFRYGDTFVMRVVFVDATEARKRGLWASHTPQGPIRLGGIEGQRYTYDHHDGPFYIRTIAYVVPYRDRYLGLEFRTDHTTLTPTQQQIVASFHLK